MQSVADLNAAADDDAARYTQVVLLTSDLLDGSNVAGGGAAQSVTWSPAGDEGPLGGDTPAIDGIAWSSLLSFDLTESATHFGLVRSGVVHFTDALPHPIGPGTDLPYVQGVGPGSA